MTIETHTNDRKALVKAIAEELGVPSTYLRAPTYRQTCLPVLLAGCCDAAADEAPAPYHIAPLER